MNNIKELIEKIISDYGVPTIKSYHDEDCDVEDNVVAAFIEFGRQVCELQKQECLDNSEVEIRVFHQDNYSFDEFRTLKSNITWEDIYDRYGDSTNSIKGYFVDKQSILNSNNVCDE